MLLPIWEMKMKVCKTAFFIPTRFISVLIVKLRLGE
tara:strand:+ start:120 stop:227 length:108 start_codon:yes stop_codon:yes gene_type:complete